MTISVTNLVNSAATPFGTAGSLISDPNLATMSDLGSSMNGLQACFGSLPSLSSAMSACTQLHADMQSYSSDKLSKITSELPMMSAASSLASTAQANAAQLDSAIDSSKSGTAIEQAFAPSSITCPSVSSGFSTLTTGVGNTASAAKTAAASALDGLPPSVKSVMQQHLGPFSSGSELLQKIAAAPATALSSIASGVASFESSLSGFASSISSSIASVSSSFASSVAEEAANVAKAGDFLKGMTFLNTLNSPDPCTRQVAAAVAPSASATVAAAIVTESPASIDSPTTNAIQTAKRVEPLTKAQVTAKSNALPAPNGDVADAYTPSEIDSMHSMYDAANDAYKAKLQAAAEWLKPNIEDWKISVGWTEKRNAAAPTTDQPYGTTTDQAALNAWKPVYIEYRSRADNFNTMYAYPNRAAKAQMDAMYIELKLRMRWGKHPYTNMAAAGYPVDPIEQTTLLDTTK